MEYEILARKWRPKSFQDVIGQNHILTAISNSLKSGKIHQSWLLSGTRGVGKTTLARLLAKSLNCKIGVSPNPCLKCTNCKDIEQGCFIDLIEVDAASKTKVEDIKDLLSNIQYSPTIGKFKVFIIDEVHMLSRYSFNALLKILEEPPSHVKFILATTEPEKLPDTIVSRCLNFNLKEINSIEIYNKIKHILKKEKVLIENEAIKLLSQSANGSMRDALSLTEQAIALGNNNINTKTIMIMLGMIDKNHAMSFLLSLINNNKKQLITLIELSDNMGIEWEQILIELLKLLHHIAMVQSFPKIWKDENYSIEQNDILLKISKQMSFSEIQKHYKIILSGRQKIKFYPTKKMAVELTLLRVINLQSTLKIKDENIKTGIINTNQLKKNNNAKNIQEINNTENFFIKKK